MGKMGKKQVLCILLGIILAVAGYLVEKRDGALEDGNRLNRYAYGEGERQQEVWVRGLCEKEIPVEISLGEREYAEEDAKKAFADGERGQIKESVRKVQRVLDELIESLDFSYELSNQLYALYTFCKRELARSLYQNSPEGLREAEKILRRLYGSFVQAASQDTSGPVMGNAQQVYAGMTYGRGQLTESYMDNDSQRGFFV